LDIQNAQALGFGDNSAATGTVVNNTLTGQGTLQIDDPNAATDGGGYTVANELLTLNGFGFGSAAGSGIGALFNSTGNNTWAGNVILGSAQNGSAVSINVAEQTSLTVSGTGLAANGVPLPAVSNPNGPYSLTKTGNGTLIFNTPNTYSSGTTVSGGTLEI